MIGLLTYSTEEYKPLADITNANKVEYCSRWEYLFRSYTVKATPGFPFDKLVAVKEALDYCDWVWYTGTDSLITNMAMSLQNVIDNGVDFIITTDRNGINADSFAVKSSIIGIAILDRLISMRDDYPAEKEHEQGAIKELMASQVYKDNIRILPQRQMNSYDYRLYGGDNHDKLGTCGQWQEGDLLIHWPGTSFEHRMRLAQEYLGKVVR